jgi:hypothetical protein
MQSEVSLVDREQGVEPTEEERVQIKAAKKDRKAQRALRRLAKMERRCQAACDDPRVYSTEDLAPVSTQRVQIYINPKPQKVSHKGADTKKRLLSKTKQAK